MKSLFIKKIKSQKGQSVVEFALVLPIFIVILFGIIEFSRLWETVNVLTSAAREGARVAAVTAPSMTPVNRAVQNVISAANLGSASVSLNGPNANSEVTVTVRINYSPITGSVVPGIRSLSLSRSATTYWEN